MIDGCHELAKMNLLNFDNISNGIISGLNCETLQWVMRELNKREIYEMSDSFLSMLNDLNDSNERSTEFQSEFLKN